MFVEQLEARVKQHSAPLCIGLDPDVDFILNTLKMSVFDFNRAVIEATCDIALCYKPQIAHYSAAGLEKELQQTIHFIHQLKKQIPVILDAKRGDIGSTATHYAEEAFKRYDADAVTVNPYLGFDSIEPFLTYSDRGVIVLARTSNPSADWPQLQCIDGVPLYLALAKHIANCASTHKNLAFVVGAQDKDALQKMRAEFPTHWLLVPGVGTQGGEVKTVLRYAKNKVMINVSRAILYPSIEPGQDYFAAVRAAALSFHQSL